MLNEEQVKKLYTVEGIDKAVENSRIKLMS